MSKIDITDKDIVIIGNGPSAICDELGDLIDSFHNVVRINRFRIDGFEKFVGTKTTQWITYTHCQNIVKNRENFEYIFYLNPPSWKYVEKFEHFKQYYSKNYDVNIFKKILPFPEVPFWETRSRYKYQNPSSGLVSIILFSHMYERVFVSGFDFFLSDKFHYGDNVKGCHHNGETEKTIFNILQKKEKNIFYLRDFL